MGGGRAPGTLGTRTTSSITVVAAPTAVPMPVAMVVVATVMVVRGGGGVVSVARQLAILVGVVVRVPPTVVTSPFR